MRRQLQTNYAPMEGATKKAKILDGGTGADNVDAAVSNLGLISKSLLNQPNGIASIDSETGKLPIDSVGSYYSSIPSAGLSIEGPLQLIHGAVSVYHLTEYKTDLVYSLSVNVGSVSITEDEISIMAPATGSEVVLTINDRKVTIPIGTFKPIKTKIITPSAGSSVPKVFQVTAERYQAEPLIYSDWATALVGTKSIAVPDSASSIEFEGRSSTHGHASVTVKGVGYVCGVATVRRSISIDSDSVIYSTLDSAGSLKYRFIIPSSTHISTDWEMALDEGFTKIFMSSYNNTESLQKWNVTITPGTYYVRVRYKGRFSL